MNLSKNRRIVFILASGGLLALAVILVAIRPIRAAGPWYVATGGDDGNDCQTATTPCATVNGVLGKPGFVGGDTVVVAIGTYTGTGDEVVLLDKAAILSGGWDETFAVQEGMSTIDGQGARKSIRVDTDVTAVVERFTVANGYSREGGGISLVGGGIYNAGTLTLDNSIVSGNTAMYGGGISNGGGTSENLGTLILNNSIVSGNTADSGGGIYNDVGGSVLTLNKSTVSGNIANDGGGICNCGGSGNGEITLVINNSTLRDNTANSRGGGILNGHKVALNNSTISGNTASEGGGISNYHTVAIHSSTVSGNTGGWSGGGIRNYNTLTLANSILANNTSWSGPDCAGSIGSSGFNLIGDTTDCGFTPTTGDLTDVDARLFPLVGLPGYHPLLPDSPAIDAGNPAGCTDHLGDPLTTDQRGIPRPLDGNGDGDAFCDIGSYEFDPEHPIVSVYLPVILRNY